MIEAVITPSECRHPSGVHQWRHWDYEPEGSHAICEGCRMIHMLDDGQVLLYGRAIEVEGKGELLDIRDGMSPAARHAWRLS